MHAKEFYNTPNRQIYVVNLLHKAPAVAAAGLGVFAPRAELLNTLVKSTGR